MRLNTENPFMYENIQEKHTSLLEDQAYHDLYLEYEQNTNTQKSLKVNQIIVYQDKDYKT